MLQVGVFRLTGKRIFAWRRSHHFDSGVAERNDRALWIVSFVLVLVVFTLKIVMHRSCGLADGPSCRYLAEGGIR